MGVAGDFLPRVLESTGRIVDLRDYRDGVLLPETALSLERTNSNTRRRRPLRIGIDVSAWIYRAGFAFGDRLMQDDRHLTSYGRANLQKEQLRHQQLQQLQPNTTTTTTSSRITDTEAEAEKLRDYCEACANYVVRRLELLKQGSGADLLVVFDGRTPPIKTATVSHRKQSREAYQKLRDNNNNTNTNGEGGGGDGDGASESGGTTRNTTTATAATNARGLDVEADIEERVKANRRAGPGEHVPRIVDAIIEKLRQKAASKKSTTTNKEAREKNGKHDDPSQKINKNNVGDDNWCLAAWMVAPYEADSQLAYLSKQSYIDLVITEDTDLIAHGCRSVMYKCIENHTGGDDSNNNSNSNRDNDSTGEIHIDITRGKMVEFEDLGGTRVFVSGGPSKPDLMDFTPVMMAVLFVLLGCDYNGHRKLKGIGILRACKIVRKAFLESSSNEASRKDGHNNSNSNSNSSAQEEKGRTSMIPFSPQLYATTKSKSLSCLDIVWKEAYEQSYEPNNFYTEDFKRDYQKSFVEALWMYRHPIVFDPMIRACIQSPSPVSWNNDGIDGTNNSNNSNSNSHDNRMGDPELMEGCQEYLDLCSDPIRIMQVVGELPPTQEESVSIAEGRSHSQWKLRKPTPIYSRSPKSPSKNCTNSNKNTAANNQDHHPSKSPATTSARSRRKRRETTPSPSPSKKQRKEPTSSRRKRTAAAAAASNGENTSEANRNGSQPGTQTGESSSSSPAFRSRRVKKSNNNNNKSTLEPNVDEDPPSTKSDHRRSLDNDEIAAIAAGGIKKGDRRPASMVGRDTSGKDKRNENGGLLSRNLFDDDTNETNARVREEAPSPRRKPPPIGQPSPSVQSYESGKTVPLSATPGKGNGSFFNANTNADEMEAYDTERSPNLLASSTPDPSKDGMSTRSSSRATLSLSLSLSASVRDTIGGTGTQSSSKATTHTLSQTLSQSQSQRTTQTQSSSKTTPKTPSSAKSVDLLASSATSTHSIDFTTPLQLQSQFQTPTQSQSQTQSQTQSKSQSKSQSQSPHFSTQEELSSKELLLESQSPLIGDDTGETKMMLTQEEDIVEGGRSPPGENHHRGPLRTSPPSSSCTSKQLPTNRNRDELKRNETRSIESYLSKEAE